MSTELESATEADRLLAEVMQRNVVVNQPTSERTAGCIDEESVVGCLKESVSSVFSKMCGIELTELPSGETSTRRHELSGIIGISGAVKATVVINIEPILAFSVADSFLGFRPEEINNDVTDLVGELANMVGGNAKERLGRDGAILAQPTVVAGPDHVVAFGPDMHVNILKFQSDQGALQIEIGIVLD